MTILEIYPRSAELSLMWSWNLIDHSLPAGIRGKKGIDQSIFIDSRTKKMPTRKTNVPAKRGITKRIF